MTRTFNLATAPSRFAPTWRNRTTTWDAFVEKLSTPLRSDEKDKGGYVAGYLRDGLRRGGHAETRSMITLDADSPSEDFILRATTALFPHAYALHETHSSTPSAPRYRLVVPLAADVTAEQYVPAALALMQRIGLEHFDPTTAQPERLMYWPVRQVDAYEFFSSLGDSLLDAETLLADYPDWRDSTCWPDVAHKYRTGEIKKMGDPREKSGLVGAFNRAHSIPSAIVNFLPDVYEETSGGRWTFTAGHSTGGLAIYDDETVAYSNHGTDPAYGRALSAFDLVRVHKFGHLDEDPAAPLAKLRSQSFMLALASDDPAVRVELDRERRESAAADFADEDDDLLGDEVPGQDDEADIAARRALSARLDRHHKTGETLATADNLALIFEGDPGLAGAVGTDLFSGGLTLKRDLPWRRRTSDRPQWVDSDDAQLRVYVETEYGIYSPQKVNDALASASERHAFHPVRDYLDGLVWDGTPRLDTLLVDYLKAVDTPLTRAFTRKTLVAAVARVKQEASRTHGKIGVKFDTMLVLVGDQGAGKSTLPRKLAGVWFSDSAMDLRSKDAYQTIAGQWIVELGELSATKKADVEHVKQFLSAQADTYRASYERRAATRARQCIFWGTTNETEFLRDRTGNRRFWPVRVHRRRGEPGGPAMLTDAEVAQIWAEAVVRYEEGEALYLDGDLEAEAEAVQAEHSETDELEGQVFEYLDVPLPASWSKLDKDSRRLYIQDALSDPENTPADARPRQRVCMSEVFHELLGTTYANAHPAQRSRVQAVLNRAAGWQRGDKKVKFSGGYGVQNAWVRDE